MTAARISCAVGNTIPDRLRALMSAPVASSLTLRVQPGARRSEIVDWHGDSVRVRVAVPPTRGKANAAVITLLADCLQVARADVTIVRGLSSRDKIVLIAGLDSDELNRRLQIAIDATNAAA